MKMSFLKNFCAGFCGALFCLILFHTTDLEAALKRGSFSSVNFFNASEQRVGNIGAQNQGQGVLFLFNEQGNITAQMGSYGTGHEKGQSLIGLHDRSKNLRLLSRLHGKKDVPLIIMKDDTGRDRLIIGLDGQTQAPVILYTNSSGQLINLLK